MRPILALNCLLQIEQERSEEESSVGDVCICFYFNTLLPVFVEFEVNFKQEYLDNFMPLIIIIFLLHRFLLCFTDSF